ncbi:MAG TPA: ammonium transporter [Acidimicrobiales bacterium]|nr:ammonium transporter [Acidimicrobiales bacterium]
MHLIAIGPYPSWLNPGDNAWQLVAATLVGLMSLPALAVLYGGLVQRRWIVNTMLMAFVGFSAVLVVWVLWGYNLAFGPLSHFGATGSFLSGFVGKFWPMASHFGEQNQAVSGALPSGLHFHFPTATFAYFQVVFAAITPLLFLGAVVGRIKFRAWLFFVPLWITFVYCINAALLWGGGFLAQKGAVDYSGGYVIHLSAGVAGFVAAWVVGPRLRRDRDHGVPNNLMMVALGAGILWLGWNGFNGGDPFYAGVDAASAVLNTNLATATAVLTWVVFDICFSRARKPTFLGAINGMICGLVGITPSAGWVNGFGAIMVGLICSSLVWVSWNYLSRVRPFSKVDDALGVVYTHGIAGLVGGLLVGVLADPGMIEYVSGTKHPGGPGSFGVSGFLYSHSFHQLWEQFLAASWIIVFTAVATFLILRVVKVLARGLREPDEVLLVGDLAIHDEEALPRETFAERVDALARHSNGNGNGHGNGEGNGHGAVIEKVKEPA